MHKLVCVHMLGPEVVLAVLGAVPDRRRAAARGRRGPGRAAGENYKYDNIPIRRNNNNSSSCSSSSSRSSSRPMKSEPPTPTRAPR